MSEKEVRRNQKHDTTKRYTTMTNATTTNERRDFKENYFLKKRFVGTKSTTQPNDT